MSNELNVLRTVVEKLIAGVRVPDAEVKELAKMIAEAERFLGIPSHTQVGQGGVDLHAYAGVNVLAEEPETPVEEVAETPEETPEVPATTEEVVTPPAAPEGTTEVVPEVTETPAETPEEETKEEVTETPEVEKTEASVTTA